MNILNEKYNDLDIEEAEEFDTPEEGLVYAIEFEYKHDQQEFEGEIEITKSGNILSEEIEQED